MMMSNQSHVPSCFCTNSCTLGNASAPQIDEKLISQFRFLFFLWVGLIILAVVGLIIYRWFFSDQEKQDADTLLETREIQPVEPNIPYEDIKGLDEAKSELEQVLYYLRDPDRFTRLGARLKTVLLVGPPGTGKSMLARAVATEAEVPFFTIDSSEFEREASKVKKVFDAAKEKSPCILFIDNLDVVHFSLNELLVELDDLERNNYRVVVIGATHSPSLLYNSLVRAGRFDHEVIVPMPDIDARREILEHYMSKIVASCYLDLDVIARETSDFSPADIAGMVNIAAVRAAMYNVDQVRMIDIEYAIDRITMGTERRSQVKSRKLKKIVAYHEGGHALVGVYSGIRVYKATIVSRGMWTLGLVSSLVEKDNEILQTRKYMLAQLNFYMGGRAAEEIIFGDDEVTNGASDDIKEATSLATCMVTKYGMSSKVGLVFCDYEEGSDSSKVSSETRSLVENEVREMLDKAYENAVNILITHLDELHALANALLEHETLSESEIYRLVFP